MSGFSRCAGQYAAQTAVAHRVLRQQREMVPTDQGYLHPLDRFKARFPGSNIELHRSTQIIMVGKSQSRHTQMHGPFHQAVNPAASIQKGIFTMYMQVDKHIYTPFELRQIIRLMTFCSRISHISYKDARNGKIGFGTPPRCGSPLTADEKRVSVFPLPTSIRYHTSGPAPPPPAATYFPAAPDRAVRRRPLPPSDFSPADSPFFTRTPRTQKASTRSRRSSSSPDRTLPGCFGSKPRPPPSGHTGLPCFNTRRKKIRFSKCPIIQR